MRLAGALWGRRVEAHETAALLEPYGEWAGLASAHLLALSGRMNAGVDLRQRAADLARQVERDVLVHRVELVDVGHADGREPVDDAPHERLGRARAGRDADRADAVEPGLVDRATRPRSGSSATPASRATSTSRFEFDELRDPITSTRSTSRTSAFTAAWRFEVA